jgi:hypothetical protein
MDSLALAAIVLLVILIAVGGYMYWEKTARPWAPVAGPEVYHYAPTAATGWDWQQAAAAAASLGGALATIEQVTAAQKAGAQWCSWGWAQSAPGHYGLAMPRQVDVTGCGPAGVNQMVPAPNTLWGALVYGIKPPAPAGNCGAGAPCIQPWSDGVGTKPKWSQYS